MFYLVKGKKYGDEIEEIYNGDYMTKSKAVEKFTRKYKAYAVQIEEFEELEEFQNGVIGL